MNNMKNMKYISTDDRFSDIIFKAGITALLITCFSVSYKNVSISKNDIDSYEELAFYMFLSDTGIFRISIYLLSLH